MVDGLPRAASVRVWLRKMRFSWNFKFSRNRTGIILWASRTVPKWSRSIWDATCTSTKILWNMPKHRILSWLFFAFYEFWVIQKRKNNEFEGLLWIRAARVVHISTCDSWSLASFKSNSKAQEIERQHACQKSVNFEHKNQDFSKSVNSFHSGAIFPPSLGQDLSRNAFVVSVYAF